MRYCDLRDKEVINICDGRSLGYINDLEIDCSTGCIISIIVPAPCKFWCFFKAGEDYIIPWCKIQKLGQDVILVELRHGGAKVSKV